MVDEDFEELAWLFIDIAREIRARAALTTPIVPLTQTQSQVMQYVHAHPGCSASDIADGASLQRTNVSTILRELRGRGYITSERDELDGRAIRIHATELADETIAALQRSWAGIVADAWRAGGADEASVPLVVAESLARIRAGLGADRARKGFRSDPPTRAVAAADSTQGAPVASANS